MSTFIITFFFFYKKKAADERRSSVVGEKRSRGGRRLQDLPQQATELKKRVSLQQTQQLALRNNLDRETAQNNLLRETQRTLRDQLTSLQATNRLQTESIAALEGQTALAVNQSQVCLL